MRLIRQHQIEARVEVFGVGGVCAVVTLGALPPRPHGVQREMPEIVGIGAAQFAQTFVEPRVMLRAFASVRAQ